jgi:small-conductance mechanosensitive channel
MEGLEIYDFLRLVFITFIISLIVISIILLVQRKRSTIVNGFTVSITSIISIIVSGINLIIMGYIADELNLAGDVISSYMFLIIIGLSILNWFIYSKNKKSII